MMVASILRGRRAVAISIEILRAFARSRRERMEEPLDSNQGMLEELNRLASSPLQLLGEEPGMVTYFIQAGGDGLIKIGVTTDLEKRLRGLQTSSPARLRILVVVEKDVALAEWRVHGEWFKPVPEVLAFIEEQLPSERSLN